MTQRRQFAIAYTLAIPILFAFLMFEVGALYRLDAHSRALATDASVLEECDHALSALQDSETAEQGYIASGSDYYRSSFSEASARLSGSLQALDSLLKPQTSLQPSLKSLRQVVEKRQESLQHAMDGRGDPRLVKTGPKANAEDAGTPGRIQTIITEIRMQMQRRSQAEQANAASSASALDNLVKYGGVVTIWIVGVAALLLFHDGSAQSRDRIEQRLHTDILETLPLGICLTTESGIILYANRSFEGAFGYAAGELVARGISILGETGETAAESNLVEIAAHLRPRDLWHGELPVRTKDGNRVCVTLRIACIRIGDKDCRVLMHASPGARSDALIVDSAISVRGPSEAAGEIAAQLRGPAMDAQKPPKLPYREEVGASRRAKQN